MRFDTHCNICGGKEFREFGRRSDGIPVLLCARCGHGVVESFTDDVAAIYGDQYYSSAVDSGQGYGDYDLAAEYGVGWAAAFFDALQIQGKVLDIGCASGRLLGKLGGEHERYGIELNDRAAQECRSAGITIVASSVLDESLRKDYAKAFDFEFAIAVFEHIPDFKGAVEAALALLRPDGILFFELPVISPSNPDEPWLKTSLEHIHYPSEQSLHHLFSEVLGLKLYGSSLTVRNFGNTYIGLTSKSEDIAKQIGDRLHLWRTAPPASLSPEQARFRWMLDVSHAAHIDPAAVALYRHLEARDISSPLVGRLLDLWIGEATRLDNTLAWLAEVERARDAHAAESRRRGEVIDALNKENFNKEAIGKETFGPRQALLRFLDRLRKRTPSNVKPLD